MNKSSNIIECLLCARHYWDLAVTKTELTFDDDDDDDDSSHLLSLPSAKITRNTCVGVYKHTNLIVGIFRGSRDRVSDRLLA